MPQTLMIDSFAVFKRSYWKLIKQLDTTTISTATTDRHYLEKKCIVWYIICC